MGLNDPVLAGVNSSIYTVLIARRIDLLQVHPRPPAFAVEYSSVTDRNTKYVVYDNLTRSGDVALDWVTGAIYVTDEGIHRILVCQARSTWSSGGMCAELARTSPPDVPKYLALHPPSG